MDIASTLSQYITTESVTVVGSLTLAYLGWKVASKGVSMATAIASKATKTGIAGLLAAALFMSGIGGVGYSIGELAVQTPDDGKPAANGMTDNNLLYLAKTTDNEELASEILAYAKLRDSKSSEVKMQALADLVASANEHNKEAITEYVKLLQHQEGETQTHLTSARLVDLENLDDTESSSDLEPVLKSNTLVAEKTISYQSTWAMFMSCLAASAVSIILYQKSFSKDAMAARSTGK